MKYKKEDQSTLIANIEKSISINFLEKKLIPTGFFIEFYKNIKYCFFIKKQFIEAICIIHIEKKEIKIIVINIFLKPIIIIPNEKLAILNMVKKTKIKWNKCTILNKSMRGDNSFGSSGI
ncbi:dCTP deaminase/dUTPase family protein [Blattabacterium cuenoti]|uniref:dUTP diphosphatase n=1 Tax=Blattabacterium cuenoti TaxID=1653831 RepID=UPI00163C2689|nr:dUTP diphosphatase [Blattabacterium cuenoti]